MTRAESINIHIVDLLARLAAGVYEDGVGGSPVIAAWHKKQEAGVLAGKRPAASLVLFDPEAVRKSTVTFAPEPSSPSESDEGW